MRLKISLEITCFFATIISFIIIFGNIEKLNIDIAYGVEEYTFSKTWGSSGTGDGQFMFPHSLVLTDMEIFMLQIQEIIEFKNLVPLDLLLQNGEKRDLLMVNLDSYMT